MSELNIQRKAEKVIMDWIQNGQKALLVYGIRQAGKTYSIRKCLQQSNADFVEFNLIETPEVAQILQNASSINDMVMRLSLFSEKKITPEKTIIFFDEIQCYKEIVTKIKFLVEDRRFRYVMSGSLLGVELRNLRSAPVGYVQTLKMFPLDFEEFVHAFNVMPEIFEQLKECMKNCVAVDEVIHKKMMDFFNLYLIVGGMPAAVSRYLESRNIEDVIEEHQSLLELYKLDFTQYETDDKKLIISKLYEMIPAELNENNKRFVIANLDKNLRKNRVEESFVWLEKSGVALPVYNVVSPQIPLMLNQKSAFFKLFLSDSGLLTSLYGRTTKLKILNNERDINKGAIYENVVAQELIAHGKTLYYYNSKKFGELDFVTEIDDEVLPIEVKSGKAYQRHSALENVLNCPEYNIQKAVVFSNANVSKKGDIIYLPLYMVMFL